MKIHTRTHAVP